MAKLSPAQSAAYGIICSKSKWESSYTLKISLGTLKALSNKGLIESRHTSGSVYSPRTGILWRAVKGKQQKVKKDFLIEVFADRSATIFKEGMKPGVLASCIYSFELTEEEYNSPTFLMSLINYEEELIKQTIKSKISKI